MKVLQSNKYLLKNQSSEGTVQGFNGYFGETDPSKTNGRLNITMNSNEVANGKLLITGERTSTVRFLQKVQAKSFYRAVQHLMPMIK